MARGWMWGALALTIACKGGGADDVAEPTDDTDDTDTTTPDTTALTAPLPGFGSIDGASIEVVGSRADGLNVPRDLEFNPAVPGELWVVNRADDSTTIFHGMGTPDQSSEHRIDPFALHFMEEVSSLSFGAATFDGSDAPTWGSCQESRNTYNGQSSPNDFMGPSLWTADLDIFAYSNPEAVDYLTEEFGFPADLGSHLDMLHESPMCMGIAWETENVYWVFDGRNEQIVRYDFQEDHDVGYDDHSDGLIWRISDLSVNRIPDIPSHMVVDQASKLLYVVDTGNRRLLEIDTQTGTKGSSLPSIERGTDHAELDGVVWNERIDLEAFGLDRPSGLALVDDTLIIGDYTSGDLFAFSLEGELLGRLETGREESLMGIEALSATDLWVVDAKANEVLRIRP